MRVAPAASHFPSRHPCRLRLIPLPRSTADTEHAKLAAQAEVAPHVQNDFDINEAGLLELDLK